MTALLYECRKIHKKESELGIAKTYKLISTYEKSVAHKHCNDIAT